ncbi:MAG TPA: 50S ribosomal protein L6 [Candidatus Hydrogenedentes bacterium]|nr:50S ribosomal protein L6 [Candidatus Hydrogenedentota bacterium]
MSRVGRMPVPIPGGVKCELTGSRLKVTGPKGTLEADFSPEITIEVTGTEIRVSRSSDRPKYRALHGLTRALINNMVQGVTTGFKKTLLLEGTGYRVSMQGKSLNVVAGFSHPVVFAPPEGITLAVEGTQTVHVQGIDKQLVGEVTAQIRKIRKVEPYKGKGFRYEGEFVARKESKKGA